MRLNTLKPKAGSRKKGKRLGRGIGSTKGKTCGRGHKGQRARAGGYHKVGFEGGQTPLQRRTPKFGFTSLTENLTARLRLSEIAKFEPKATIDIKKLKEAKLVSGRTKKVKVFLSGEISHPLFLSGIIVTSGAKLAIEAAGGKVE